MRASGELDNYRESNLFQKIVNIGNVAANQGLGRVHASLSKNLLGTQFVACTSNSNRAGGHPSSLHLKLAHHSATITSHTISNTWNNRIESGEDFAPIVDVGVFFVKGHVAILILDHFDFVTPFLSFFHQAFGRVVSVTI